MSCNAPGVQGFGFRELGPGLELLFKDFGGVVCRAR